MNELLRIEDLRVTFGAGAGGTTALDGVSLTVDAGEALGLVGETGCGKTMTGLSVLRLLPPAARVVGGTVRFEGEDLLGQSERRMRALRGRRVAMIFQNPSSAFNPVFTVGWQIDRVLRQHSDLSARERRTRMGEVLNDVGLPDLHRVVAAYPHQLSGGMLQRAMIAMALVNSPSLVIADEPTTALDATIAAQILALLRRLQQQRGFAILMITHNLGVVRQVCERVAVLYAGRVIETMPTVQLLSEAQHPYTRALLRAVPGPGTRGTRLAAIEGTVPTDPGAIAGCAFQPRCPLAFDDCQRVRPPAVAITATHASACLLAPSARPAPAMSA